MLALMLMHAGPGSVPSFGAVCVPHMLYRVLSVHDQLSYDMLLLTRGSSAQAMGTIVWNYKWNSGFHIPGCTKWMSARLGGLPNVILGSRDVIPTVLAVLHCKSTERNLVCYRSY